MAHPLNLVCPYCFKSATHEVETLATEYHFACPACEKPFIAVVMTVRAKSGRQNKKAGLREITIRGSHLTGQEDVVTVVKSGTDDVEARSKDVVAITFAMGKNGRPARAGTFNNYTVKKWWQLSRPSSGCLGIGATACVVLAVAAGIGTANAQDTQRHYVYLPSVRFEPTPVVPHCRVIMHTDFESDLGGWTFGSEGHGERTQADLPLDGAGPWVAQLRPGTDGVVALTSPEFEAPSIPGFEKTLYIFLWHRNLEVTVWGSSPRLVSAVVRSPLNGGRMDTQQVGSASPMHTADWFQGSGGGVIYGVWTGWPKLRARVGAVSDGTSDVIWQIDSLKVEICYRRPFRSVPLADQLHVQPVQFAPVR